MNYPCRCGAETSPFEPCPVCEPKTPTTGEWSSLNKEIEEDKLKTELACEQWIRQCEELQQQLAAEREKYQRSQEKVTEYFDLLAAERELSKQSRAAERHMEACRALLNVPDDEVLYCAIEELQQQLAAAAP